MHYSEKSSQMIDCIVTEGLNPSQRYNGLVFTRQMGNIYLMGHPSMSSLEAYRHQFVNMPDDIDIYESYFESVVVPDLSSPEGAGLSLCFSHHQDSFSQEQLSSLPGLLSAGNDLPTLARLYGAANPDDGKLLVVFWCLCLLGPSKDVS